MRPLALELGVKQMSLRSYVATKGGVRRRTNSVRQTAHAYTLPDSCIHGFAVQDAALPFEGRDTAAEITSPILELFATGEYPHMVEIATT